MNDSCLKWVLRLWLIGMAIGSVLWIWKHFPVGFILVAAVIMFMLRGSLVRRRQGYWVEYVSPGILRAGEDDFAVVYHEADNQHFFYGKRRRLPASEVLVVPSEAAWQANVPEWMSTRRAVILARIQREISGVRIIETEDD